jgi:hypothetical protein
MKITFYFLDHQTSLQTGKKSKALHVELLEGNRKIAVKPDMTVLHIQRFLAGQDHYLWIDSDTLLYRYGSRSIDKYSENKRFTILQGDGENQIVLKVPEKNVYKLLADYITIRGYGFREVVGGTDTRLMVTA